MPGLAARRFAPCCSLRAPAETKVSAVSFDSHGAGTRATTADPTGADLHTARMRLEDAAAVLAASLRQLGSSDAAAGRWVEEARPAGV